MKSDYIKGMTGKWYTVGIKKMVALKLCGLLSRVPLYW